VRKTGIKNELGSVRKFETERIKEGSLIYFDPNKEFIHDHFRNHKSNQLYVYDTHSFGSVRRNLSAALHFLASAAAIKAKNRIYAHTLFRTTGTNEPPDFFIFRPSSIGDVILIESIEISIHLKHLRAFSLSRYLQLPYSQQDYKTVPNRIGFHKNRKNQAGTI
jgi:hypothetical protein